MIARSRFLVFCGGFLFSLLSFAQKEDWLPVTPQDLDIKQVPGAPGADAIQLYYADYINDEEQTEFFYHRVKILQKGALKPGKGLVDVEIVVPVEGSISGLKARTIHPDGKIIEYTGKPFQKTVFKTKGLKVLAKTFTMPDVTVGSIIEYKYKIGREGYIVDHAWTIQHSLYTVKESYRMKGYTGRLEDMPDFQIAALYSNMPNSVKPQQKGGGYEMDLQNMAAFESEGYMPPEEDFKPQVRFFYIGRQATTADKFWQEQGRKWNDDVERFIGNRGEIRQAAEQAIGDETEPGLKLRKLYGRAQKIRNLSYERERTEAEQKKEHLKDNQNAGDVLARGAGYRNDITRLFVALARAAGFEAAIVRVSNRHDKFFDKNLLSNRQLDTEIAVVKLLEKDFFLDPATPYCAYGMLRWNRTSTTGLKLDKKGGSFVIAPPAPYDKAVTRRTADVTLDADGNLKGTLTVKYEGGEALEHRIDAQDSDEAGRTKELEEEVKGWLTPGSSAKLGNVEGWEGTDDPLIATFEVYVPSYASVAGSRVLVPAFLFQSKQMDAFKHAERKFPVYFPYAFTEADRVNIKLPPGFTVESVPANQTAQIGFAGYQNTAQFAGQQLVTQRVLQVNGIFFKVELYPQIKDFFGKVQAGDEQQAVLKGGRTNAQTSN